jgi:hypothetical protein
MQIIPRKPQSIRPPALPDDLLIQIVESETFGSAPMMRTLLMYLWKHQGEPFSEYAVAIDALGKPADFDPRVDSTVRVQISRLRAKLKEFYESHAAFPLKVSVPLGRHELQWTYEPPQPVSTVQPKSPVPKVYVIAASALFAVLLTVCVFLFLRVRGLEKAQISGAPPLPQFWQSFANNSKPVEIVIPSPLYFFWPDRGVNVRDFNISEFPNWPSSPWLREMAAKWGPPTLSQNYVGVPEMNTGVRLLQFLQGRVGQLEVVESRKFATDMIATRNNIFIGMPRTAAYLDQISRKLNFYVERVEPDVVGSRNPLPGEQKQFAQIDYSADRIRFPGIIALLPSHPEKVRSLLLLGRSPLSMATMLTSADGLRLLDQQWRKSGSPDAWEMVIEADVYRGDTVANVKPVSFRAISTDFWK